MNIFVFCGLPVHRILCLMQLCAFCRHYTLKRCGNGALVLEDGVTALYSTLAAMCLHGSSPVRVHVPPLSAPAHSSIFLTYSAHVGSLGHHSVRWTPKV